MGFVFKGGVLGGERFLGLLTKFSDMHTAGTVCNHALYSHLSLFVLNCSCLSTKMPTSQGTSNSKLEKTILVTGLSGQHSQVPHDPAPRLLQPLFVNIFSKQGEYKQQHPHWLHFSSQTNG